MKKKVFLAVLLLLFAGFVILASFGWWWFREDPREWTTRSPAALGELEQGLENYEKYYWADAARHFERALELDPEFVAAKLFRLRLMLPGEEEKSERIREEVLDAELEDLTARERYLVEDFRARVARDPEEVARLNDEFMAEHPGDRFALGIRCDRAWAVEDWESAEECYERLLALHPNRVFAQNRLGYIAMARGRFDQAEERFRTYRFIAPDQANPHDSLGQLLALRGRLEEAEESFEEALRVKPDFCDSYLHLAAIHAEAGQAAAAQEALARLDEQESCRWIHERGSVCSLRAWTAYLEGDLGAAWKVFADGCLERRYGADPLAHRLALALGLEEEAQQIEARLEERLESIGDAKPISASWYRSTLQHVRGFRFLTEDDLEGAVGSFREADAAMEFWGPERASLKLLNLHHLRATLLGLGRTEEAGEIEERIRAVNPSYLELRLPDLGPQGTWQPAVPEEPEVPEAEASR